MREGERIALHVTHDRGPHLTSRTAAPPRLTRRCSRPPQLDLRAASPPDISVELPQYSALQAPTDADDGTPIVNGVSNRRGYGVQGGVRTWLLS